MTPAPAGATATAPSGQPAGAAVPHGGGDPCPTCGTPRGPGEFCEVCGYNFTTGDLPVEVAPAPPPSPPAVSPEPVASLPPPTALEPPGRWELRVTLDPAAADAPAAMPERIFPLLNDETAIGRRSLKRQITPDVPLDEDDGVSHRHASLRRQPDGASWAVLDLGSANGTRLNDADLPPNVLTPLKADDTLRLGRWTVLTLRRLL